MSKEHYLHSHAAVRMAAVGGVSFSGGVKEPSSAASSRSGLTCLL
jgi:hypothetical protein